MASEALAEEVVSTKVDTQFINNLKSVFSKFPQRTVMRFRQDPSGRLIIRVKPSSLILTTAMMPEKNKSGKSV